jgi:hypothetical protein
MGGVRRFDSDPLSKSQRIVSRSRTTRGRRSRMMAHGDRARRDEGREAVDCAAAGIVYSRIALSCDGRGLGMFRRFVFALLCCVHVLGLFAVFTATLSGRDGVSRYQTCSEKGASTNHQALDALRPLCHGCALCAFGCDVSLFASSDGRMTAIRFSVATSKMSGRESRASLSLRGRAYRAHAPLV